MKNHYPMIFCLTSYEKNLMKNKSKNSWRNDSKTIMITKKAENILSFFVIFYIVTKTYTHNHNINNHTIKWISFVLVCLSFANLSTVLYQKATNKAIITIGKTNIRLYTNKYIYHRVCNSLLSALKYQSIVK